jgi:hypothetical protein
MVNQPVKVVGESGDDIEPPVIFVGSVSVVAIACAICGARMYPTEAMSIHTARHVETDKTIRRYAESINLTRRDNAGQWHAQEKHEGIKMKDSGMTRGRYR